MSSADIRILLVDDALMFREAAATMIEAAAGFELCGVAADGDEMLTQVERTGADLVLMDVHMGSTDGISAAQQLHRRRQDIVVILMSADECVELPKPLRAEGVQFIEKRNLDAETLAELWARAHHPPDDSDR